MQSSILLTRMFADGVSGGNKTTPKVILGTIASLSRNYDNPNIFPLLIFGWAWSRHGGKRYLSAWQTLVMASQQDWESQTGLKNFVLVYFYNSQLGFYLMYLVVCSYVKI